MTRPRPGNTLAVVPRDYSSLHQVIRVARILIVDDDEADRIILSTILERAGHETFLAEGGEEALRECVERTIDVVITDLQMPGVHGLELIATLRKLSPRPVIMAISGTGSDQLEKAQAVGAKTTLSKPVDPDELLSAVTRVVAVEA